MASEVPAGLYPPCIRDIEALDTSVKQRIGKTLLRYESDPLQHAEPLKQLELGSYRFRIGDYRVVFDIEGDEIVILRIGHRRDIYTIAHSIPANQTLERRKAKQ